MIVDNSTEFLNTNRSSVMTIGTFDGVHLGHRSVIQQVVAHAKNLNYKSIAITFDPHPRLIVGDKSVKLLTTLDERIEIIKELGIDETIILNFTLELSKLSSTEFYKKYITTNLNVKEVIIGFNHAFGKDREAGLHELEQIGNVQGFKTIPIQPVSLNGQAISSSIIRKLLLEGNLEKANTFLGRYYKLNGTVIKGEERGKRLGFPTANIKPNSEYKLVPLDGVYLVKIVLEKKQYHGMLNIGISPTLTTGQERIIEVNIFDLNENIYGKNLEVYFIKRLRSEQKFISKEDLIKQLNIDRNECLKYTASLKSKD